MDWFLKLFRLFSVYKARAQNENFAYPSDAKIIGFELINAICSVVHQQVELPDMKMDRH
jgi:hypothetical protein